MERIGLQAVLLDDDFTAGVRNYNAGIDSMEDANKSAVASAAEFSIGISDLSKVLSDANPAKLATTALDQLQQEYKDGGLSAEQYAAALSQVQDEFGLVSPVGKAAAAALTDLNAKFKAGEISAEEYAEGLKSIEVAQEDAGNGAVELAAKMEIVEQVYGQIKDTIGEAIELAELGSQANRTEERFRAFASQVGDADELLAAFQKGAGGTVDEMTAMSSAARLLQMGLVSNNDEMEQVVEIATRLGDQTQSAGDRVADFALLLANQSIPRLDNFGISSGKVRSRIEELQKAFPGMSREAAFSQAVFEEGSKSLDVLGERTLDAGAKMEQARANIQNMRVEMGQRLLPIVAQAFGLIENLNTGTLALVATLGTAVGVLVKFSGGLGGAVNNLGTFAAKMGTSTVALGALAAATVVLVEAVGNLSETMDKMGQAQDNAQTAAGTLGDQVQALVDEGMSLGDAMDQVGDKVNNATANFNDARVLGVIPLKNAFNAGAEFSKTMEEATYSLQGALVANTGSYEEYTAQVAAYNAGIDDGAAKLETYTEKQHAMSQAHQEGRGFLSDFTDGAQGYTDALTELILKTSDEITATEDATRAQEDYQQSSRDAMLATEGLTAADVAAADAREGAIRTTEEIAAATEARANMAEKAARVEEMQATSALAAAAALEEKRQKDIATAQAEADLATKVMDASDAMIAQTFIQGLDPEAMGLTAYRRAVEDIQLAFGLATPESINLAHGITQGIEAANAGEIAYGDLDQFINDLIADSETGADTFAKYGVAIDESASSSDKLSGSSQALGLELAGLDEDAAIAATGMDGATESTRELESAMSETAGAAPGYGSAIGSGLRAGMEPEMDGFVASFRQKLQSIRDQLPSSEPKDSTSPLYGLGKSGAAIIENLTYGMEQTATRATDAVSDVGGEIGKTLSQAVVEAYQEAMQEAGEEDFIAPEALYRQLFGVASTLGGLGGAAGTIFQREVIDPLEEITTGLESALKEQAKIIDTQTKEVEKITPDFGEGFLGYFQDQVREFGASRVIENLRKSLEGGLTAIVVGDERVTRAQILAQQDMLEQWIIASDELNWSLEHRIDLQNSLSDTYKELNAEQERLNRLQEQQEALKFLEQQANLLELIAEKGLDAEQILGGLKLGLEADVGAVLDAMANAMQQVIAQAEEELGVASPSKVFEEIGAETMSGLAMGIKDMMALPALWTASATQAMIAAPAAIVSPRNTTIDNSRTVGDINISAPGGATAGNAQLIATIRQVVREEVRGA